MRTSLFFPLAFLTFMSGACDNKEPVTQNKSPGPVTAAASPSGHAPAHAKPGSHEDWCAEHAVPESLCTRCNASLVPAFKATGDWCVKHELPESQCLKCNPDLKIERPPKTGGT